MASDHSIGSEFYDGQIECKFTERTREDQLFEQRSRFLEACFRKFGAKIAHLENEVLELALLVRRPVVDTPGERRNVADSLNKIYLESFDNKALERLLDEHPFPAPRLLPSHHLRKRPPIPADLPQAAHLAALRHQRDIDRFLVHIHTDENLGRLFHGLPPFSVFGPPCQTCGSARPSRNPRYRGGRPPALERKPFCLAGHHNG